MRTARTRRAIRRLLLIGISLSFLWLLSVLAVIFREGSTNRTSVQVDVIVVLGAAVIDEKPSPVFAGRLLEARDLFQKGRANVIILTGGRSPEDKSSEALAGKQFLMSEGIPGDRILIEENSHTTRENLVEAGRLMREHHLHTALIVSDPLHLFRSRLLWQDLKITGTGIATTHTRYRSFGTRLRFALRELLYLHKYWLLGS